MGKFAEAFGEKYQQAVSEIRTKSFVMGGHEFKVRIPLNAEMDALLKRITEVPEDKAKERLDKMTSALQESPPENVEIKENGDVVIDGRSTKEMVASILMLENRIVEYVRLLIPLNGDLSDITYADIDEEFPFSTQLELIEKISEVIQPGYKESRKNS